MTTSQHAAAAAWITIWQRETFAPSWYRDAARECSVEGRDARRREIVLAACLAESYLYEWFRDHVVPDDEAALLQCFPAANRRRSLADRWKHAVKTAVDQTWLAGPADFSGPGWADLLKLIEYRNGLLHAGASRPVSVRPPSQVDPPVPTASTLDTLAAGWALDVVIAEIRRLHHLAGTATPAWLMPF
ncbi:MAG TPA: hypothetical protein VGK16_05505 [Candidatus Limnocylindrales bacterium]